MEYLIDYSCWWHLIRYHLKRFDLMILMLFVFLVLWSFVDCGSFIFANFHFLFDPIDISSKYQQNKITTYDYFCYLGFYQIQQLQRYNCVKSSSKQSEEQFSRFEMSYSLNFVTLLCTFEVTFLSLHQSIENDVNWRNEHRKSI